jgi:hypothetical protein
VISWPVGNVKNADIRWKRIPRLKNARLARKNVNFSIILAIPLIVRWKGLTNGSNKGEG